MPRLTVEDLRTSKGSKTLTVNDLVVASPVGQGTESQRRQRVGEGQRTWAQRRGSSGESTARAYSLSKDRADTARTAGRLGLEIATTAATGGAGAAARIGYPLARKAVQVGLAGGASSLASEAFDPSEDPMQRAKETMAFSAGGEGVGGILARGLNRLIRGGTNLEPGAEEAIEQMGKRGAQITPGQYTTNPIADVLQNISESSLTGFKKFQTLQEAQQAAAMLDIDEYVAQFLKGRGSEEVGGGIQAAVVASAKMRRELGSTVFGWVDELIKRDQEFAALAPAARQAAESPGVDLQSALQLAAKELKLSGGRNEQITKVAGWITKASEEGQHISFADAQRLRSDLLGVGRTGDEIIQGQAQGVAKRLAKSIDGSMMDYAGKLGPDVEELYRFANKFWKETAETFGDRFIKALLKAEPEQVLKKVSRREMPGTIRKVRKTVVDPLLRGPAKVEAEAVWREVQGHTMLRIARDAQDAAMQTQGKRALKIIDKYGEDTLDELFLNPGEMSTFKKLLRTLEITQAPAGKGLPGGVFVQLGQAGAIIGMMTGHIGAEAAGFVVAPEIIKHVLTNKAFSRWVTIGSKSPPGSKAALRAYVRMQAIVANEMSRYDKETTQ